MYMLCWIGLKGSKTSEIFLSLDLAPVVVEEDDEDFVAVFVGRLMSQIPQKTASPFVGVVL